MHGPVAIPLAGAVTRAVGLPLDAESEEDLVEGSRLAFRVAWSVLRQREDAEDVAQEALSRACRNLASLRDRGSFRPWLVRIAWRLALNHRRASRRRERRELVLADPARPRGVEELAAASESRARLWAAIDRLPEKLRLVTVLAGIEGHDVRAVAALAGVPVGTVKSRLHAARRRLMEALS
ncbi:MAG TPA: sigma-70 family RNA polymerase sigma factor [Vicinamibacteria bacterium]|nr:sigma-70 family RNA polymerase sigma factor [Vicinamibacteria bacterium]